MAAEIEERGIVRTLKDFFAGAAGGVAQVLIGMGFCSFCGCFIMWSRAPPAFFAITLSFVMLILGMILGFGSMGDHRGASKRP